MLNVLVNDTALTGSLKAVIGIVGLPAESSNILPMTQNKRLCPSIISVSTALTDRKSKGKKNKKANRDSKTAHFEGTLVCEVWF